jgi:hypothetical protein
MLSLPIAEEDQNEGAALESEIAQLELSDLGRGACLHANHASRKTSVV